jgi:hypothetical protein
VTDIQFQHRVCLGCDLITVDGRVVARIEQVGDKWRMQFVDEQGCDIERGWALTREKALQGALLWLRAVSLISQSADVAPEHQAPHGVLAIPNSFMGAKES